MFSVVSSNHSAKAYFINSDFLNMIRHLEIIFLHWLPDERLPHAMLPDHLSIKMTSLFISEKICSTGFSAELNHHSQIVFAGKKYKTYGVSSFDISHLCLLKKLQCSQQCSFGIRRGSFFHHQCMPVFFWAISDSYLNLHLFVTSRPCLFTMMYEFWS